MRLIRLAFAGVVALLVALGGIAALPSSASAAEIKEWPVPWENSRPRDPYVENAERVWFVGQADHYIASLNPQTGEFRRVELGAGAGPHNLIVGEDGIVWYAGNRQAHIGKYDPATGEIHKIPMPTAAARDPHTLVFDGKGNIWFTLQRSNMIGRLNMATEHVDVIESPVARSLPYGITTDPDGAPWAVLFGTNRIITADPQSLELREYVLPRAATRPRRLERTSDGMIWYVDYAEGFLGRLDPGDGSVQEWQTPGGENAYPYAMTVDDKDRLWFVESGPSPNRLVGFDPATATFFDVTDIPSGGGVVRHMVFHAPTRSIWFGTDTNTIGRAIID